MVISAPMMLIFIDYDNSCGYGNQALVSLSADLKRVLINARSIMHLIENHVHKLKSNWYMTLRNNIETYAMTPTDEGAFGSVTVTNGIKITAHAFYNHTIS
jgi:hypothetical protein